MFFSKNKSDKLLIGTVERISLPDLGIKKITARVDTGAKRSALHAENIHYKNIDGKRIVFFDVILGDPGEFIAIPTKAELKEMRTFVSSNGHLTRRPVIVTKFQLGKRAWKSQLSLIDRSSMRYRMLLGRMSMKNRFIVDVGSSYVQG